MLILLVNWCYCCDYFIFSLDSKHYFRLQGLLLTDCFELLIIQVDLIGIVNLDLLCNILGTKSCTLRMMQSPQNFDNHCFRVIDVVYVKVVDEISNDGQTLSNKFCNAITEKHLEVLKNIFFNIYFYKIKRMNN